jgi:hypothetical protein
MQPIQRNLHLSIHNLLEFDHVESRKNSVNQHRHADADLINLKAEGATIDVRGDADDQVRVEITRGDDDAAEIEADYAIEFVQDGDAITATVERRSAFGGWGNWGRRSLAIEVHLPARYDVDLTTSGGRIDVESLAGTIDARTSGGGLRFESVDGPITGRTSGGAISLTGTTGDADLRTSGGKITIGTVQGTIDAHTSGGGISIDSAGGAVNAKTSGGSITAAFAGQPDADCRLFTSGGSINVSVDPEVALTLEAKTSGSRIRTDLPITVSGELSKTRLEGDLNGGGPLLFLRTSGGSIHLNEL